MEEAVPNFRRWSCASKLKLWGVLAVATAIPTVIWALMFRMPVHSHQGPLPAWSAEQSAAELRLRADLHHLAGEIGERNLAVPENLALARDWTEAQFRRAGYTTRRETYLVDGVACSNVIAERRGDSKADELVVVGAHYDSARGTPGANDNGSGVVAMLELARLRAKQHAARTIRFVAFVNEEPPYFWTSKMGSDVHARASRAAGDKIVAMLSLETMGFYSDEAGSQKYPFPMNLIYPDTGNFLAFVGNDDSSALVRRALLGFRKHAKFPSEGAVLSARTPGAGWSDHKPFWDAGYPAIMLTDTAPFRYRAYHSSQDTEDKVDTARLARVVHGLEPVLADVTNE